MVTSRNHDSMARVYAIASAKGGVGKTTTTANLGATLADTGATVVVIDGDIGMANLGAALGVEPTGPTLHDVLADTAEPRQAAYDGPAGLTVIPGDTSLDSFAAADPQRLDSVVEAFDDADFILIDVGAGVSHETSIPLSVADAVVLVSTAERDALVDSEKTRQLTERLGGVVAGAVITRTDQATPIDEVVSGTLTANVLATIPDDEAVRESVAVGEPLVSYAPHSEAAAGYRELARQLTGRTPEPPESAPTELAAETREVLEASDSQLSDSLSESGITIDQADEPAEQPADPTESDGREERPQPTAGDDADPNVVNPFAAKPDAENPDVETPTQTPAEADKTAQPDPEAESKWADAAAGTGVDESTTPSTPERTEQSGQSVPEDAIPFGGSDESDQEAAETTVLGSALDADEGGTAGDPESHETETADEGDDEPLIPDAEGKSTADSDDVDPAAEDDGGDETSGFVVDEAEDDDEDEKRGFFSRLFR